MAQPSTRWLFAIGRPSGCWTSAPAPACCRAGTGLLSSFVRAELPGAELTLLDGAAAMLAQARARGAGSDDGEWAGARERMAHDMCATVEDQLTWLRDAGFADADCRFKDRCFAVFAGRRARR